MKLNLLIEMETVDPLDNAGLFYAKPINIENLKLAIWNYILNYRFHSHFDFAEEISGATALNVATGIIDILSEFKD